MTRSIAADLAVALALLCTSLTWRHFMDATTALLLCAGLFLAILVPFLILEVRKGKAFGRAFYNWCKPQGHSDVGEDTGRGAGGRESFGPTVISNECVDAPPSMADRTVREPRLRRRV
jgi:hypothetical protein